MRGSASMDVVKVWLYAAASVALGAWLAPLLYNAGMALVDVSSNKQTNGFLEWLAGICRAAEFPGFFGFSLVFAAGILFLPAISWMGGGQMGARPATRELRLPQGARTQELGQRLLSNPRGLRQGAVGFLLVTLLFLLIAGVLVLAGVLDWKSLGPRPFGLLLRGLFVAFALAVFQEILFRGIALGIFLRAMRPAAALGLSAMLFAFVYFLHPPPGLNVADPDAAGVGFELLGKILAQFSESRGVFGIFTPLLALGFVLAYARWRTASLFLPIGLHTGWIFVNGLLENATQAAASPGSLVGFVSGIVPLAGIVVAGVLANFLTTDPDAADPSEN
ncbi:MAG: lysostaphin resistance A-like protein [Luteolibacter sp.]